jgi:hypothetical protein
MVRSRFNRERSLNNCFLNQQTQLLILPNCLGDRMSTEPSVPFVSSYYLLTPYGPPNAFSLGLSLRCDETVQVIEHFRLKM